MPQYRNPLEKGDLYIKFDVQFPENNWISPEKLSVSSLSVLYTDQMCLKRTVMGELLLVSGEGEWWCPRVQKILLHDG
mgnify:CR=1 FL=1